jgi:NAD(P)-dependent dehydrogenase (short-subunit alcohol dehydrogenase family)
MTHSGEEGQMTNLYDISGTVAVVTGGSRGIGLAIACQFLRHGARVVVGGLDAQETESAVQQLATEAGHDCVAAQSGDVSRPDTAEALVAAAFDRFGRLDTLVCNAGIDIVKPAVDYQLEEWERILAVNLRGTFLPAQQAARTWIERGERGSVIMTSSIAARAGIAGLAPYGASKGGIDQLVRTLAVEWAKHGIRVNAVAPGYVDNVMAGVDIHSDAVTEARIRAFTPMGRRATVDEIAGPFIFLASPAAAYVTGTILAVDGGYSAQ